MKWFNNVKISVKLLGSFIIVALLSAVVGMVGIINIRTIDDADTKLYQMVTVPIGQLGEISTHYQRMRANYRDVLLKDSADEKIKNKESINERKKDINRLTADYEKLLFSDEGRRITNDFKKILHEYIELADKAYELSVNGKDKEALALFDGAAGKSRREVQKSIDDMLKSKIHFAKEIADGNTVLADRAVTVMVIIIISAILAGILLGFIIAKAITAAVNKGLAFARKIAEGDFTERIDLDQEDELGQLGKALNISADNLEDLVSNIIVSSQNLAQAVEQIASGNQNLSQRTSEQASSLEEIASTIEETTATINQNADNAGNASKTSQASEKLAMEGGRLVSDAVVSINEINQVSKKIGDIIAVINEIAFQTNLLALNAAVEAARAGEQGRGFAVVAGEVRNLAQRSGNAAKEIGDLIKNSIEKIEVGTDKANKSGEALTEIIGSVKNVNTVIAEIAAASIEQKQGINQINIAVTEMDTMTQQNAALVEETASASEEMSNQAQELLVMMERFKIREASKNDTYKTKHKEVHLRGTETKAPVRKQTAAAIAHKPASGNGKPADGIKGLMKDEGFEEF